MASLGHFASGFLQSFGIARQKKKEDEEHEQEKKARLKLFELQMERERRAAQADDEARAERQQMLGRRNDFFNSVREKLSGVQTEALPGTGVQLGDVEQTMAGPPAMGLAEALSQPDIFLKAMEGGVQLPQAPQKPDSIQFLEALRDNPDLFAIEGRLKELGANRTVFSPDLRQENAESKAVGEGFGNTFMNLQKADIDANGKIARLNRMQQLMQGVSTGRLQPTMTQISALADSLGVQIDPKLGEKQAMIQLTNEMALQLRNPSGGAGMPGAMSDKDREFLMAMPPGLGKTPEGNKLIIETSKKLAQRDKDVARLAREYRKKNGQLDEGFYDALTEFSEKHPLFDPKDLPAGATDPASMSDDDILEALGLAGSN